MTDNSRFAAIWYSLDADGKKRLAARANSSVASLQHYAQGRRGIGVDLGARLKKADKRMTDAVLWPQLYG